MSARILAIDQIDVSPDEFLMRAGEIFEVFDECRQGSGNVSYGVRIEGIPCFAKTAGKPSVDAPLPHAFRVALLRNAARMQRGQRRPQAQRVLSRLLQVVESPQGPILLYEWLHGELLREPSVTRSAPSCAFQRFGNLPPCELLRALDDVYELHDSLARDGWVASDFYDGSMLYDFEQQRIRVVDLDHYRAGPFVNDMGRMVGSTRFMAPEEFVRGSLIDQRTTVFTMGRVASVFLPPGLLESGVSRGSSRLGRVIQRACSREPVDRFDSIADFYSTWCEMRMHDSEFRVQS